MEPAAKLIGDNNSKTHAAPCLPLYTLNLWGIPRRADRTEDLSFTRRLMVHDDLDDLAYGGAEGRSSTSAPL